MRVLFFFSLFFFLLGEEGGHLGRQKRTLCLPQEAPGTRWNFDLPRDRSNLHVFLPRGKRYCLRAIAEAAIVQGFDGTSPTPVLLSSLSLSLSLSLSPRLVSLENETSFPVSVEFRGKRDLSLDSRCLLLTVRGRTPVKQFHYVNCRIGQSTLIFRVRLIVNDTPRYIERRIVG